MDLNRCKVCGGTEFYKEAGYYFCTECQTQNEDKREEILELHLEGTRVTKRKIPKNNSDKPDLSIQWTTWEQYNFILIGLTEELIELGVTPEIKFTVLQLWASYLGKIEVAFTSTEMKALPKLARSFHRKDADIIYGKLKSRKRKRKKGTGNSSIVSSQISEASSVRELNKYKRKMINEDYNRFASSQTSESDTSCFASQSLYSVRSGDSQSSMCERRLRYSNHAKDELKRMTEISKKLPMAERLNYRLKHVTTRYRTGPNNITPIKLWAILYLALRIHNESIHLGDMLRYAREGHLSYYRLDHLLPAEMALSDNDVKLLTQNNEITHRGMRKMCAEIAKFLFINEINCPNLMPLIYRYCKDLNLPKKISTYAERLIAVLPPKMTFNKLEPLIPNYEGRAMAFIIVIFKMLLGMDGITEYETSRIAEKINSDLVLCEHLDGCKKAASIGYKKLIDGGNAVDAVEAALWWLECDELYNCGYGSVLNQLGEVQMDASIMDGDRLEIGSVAAVSDIEHPISLAKFILKNYPNTIMVGEGAKNLSRCANTSWISKGNMVSPEAIVALENSSKNCNPVLKYDAEDLEHADLLKNGWETTGCVVCDGHSIAAGTTTGGSSGKMVGRIGDSPLLGCGTFANNFAGCSLSGHGETISKLGLSRNIVEQITQGSCPEHALKLNIDSMHLQNNQESGGIVLKKNGCWGVYFTTPRMPYAVVKKNIITFGADLYEKRYENKASVDDDQHMKLFSFREWQRHIECRRNILMRKHFPTKFKNDSDGFGNTELYVRFIKSALSRREEKPVVKNCKNTIPRDLTNAIEQCVTMIGESPQNLEDREIFPPSLTPQYSYLEQLLESPMYDLPHILRSTFDDAKVHYLTKPKKLIKFAAEYGIKLEIVNSSLHFLDKLVPQFEKSKMPSLGEWNKSVIVANQSENGDKDEYISPERKNSLVLFKLNTENQSYYDTVQKRMRNDRKNKDPGGERNSTIYVDLDESISDNFDFGFEDITCDGKLAIDSIQNWDSNDEPVMEFESKIDMENQTFYEKYNLKFPDNLITNNNEFFNEINSQNLLKSHKKKKLTRDFSGKFVKPNSASARMEPAVYKKPRKIMLCSKYSGRSFSEVEEQNPFESSNESSDAHVSGVLEQLFIPSEDYWMYHCVFSRVKPKNFESCESELPVSFQWLLNECADVVEMSTEDLYEQVCLVETHFAHILRTDNLRHNSYLSKDNQAKIRLCRKKW